MPELQALAVYYMLAMAWSASELHDLIDGAVEWIEKHPEAGASITLDEIREQAND